VTVAFDRARASWRRLTSTRPGAVAGWLAVGLVGWGLAALLLPNGAPLGVVLIGVIFGTVTALLGMGIILIYRVNRIINFSYAGMGGVAGVLGVHLYLESGVPYFLAIAVAVVVGLVVGGLTEVLVIRRFANSSRLVLTVATIGLAQVFGGIELIIPRFFDSAGLIGGFETPLSGTHVNVGPVLVNGNHFLIVAAVPPIIAALAWFLLRTDSGVAVRAAAENRDRALLLGIPIHRLTTLVWIIAGALAALTAMLKAPFSGSISTALGGPTLLLPALAAAVIARMESLPRAFGAGIALGIIEQLTFWSTGKASSIDVAFFVVILVALLLQRDVLSRAEEAGGATWSMAEVVRRTPIELRRLPEVRAVKYVLGAIAVFVAFWIPHQVEVGDLNLLTLGLIWGLVGLSLVVLTGWAGNISLGQFAIVGVGAIVAGNVFVRLNIDLFVTLVLAAGAGGVVALLLGLPALRIRGLFLAVTTLTFAVALDSYFLNPVNFSSFVLNDVPRPRLFGGRWDVESDLVMYHITLVFLLVTILALWSIRKTRSGRVLIAARDNARSAAASAISPTVAKLTAFVVSGVIAGLAGGLYVLHTKGTAVGTFSPADSLDVFSTAVIGGLGTMFGALFGVFAFRFLEQILSGEARLLVTGSGLLFVLMALPGGLSQLVFRVRDAGLRSVARRRGIHVPVLLEDKRVEDGDERPEEVVFADALSAGDATGAAPVAERGDGGDADGGRVGRVGPDGRRPPVRAAGRGD
jgi:branched-chain amino acid transport system permease protein